jgi:hypothetical protein
MQNLNYRRLLLKYRNNTVSEIDLSNLWECFSDKRDEVLIQNIFLDDLNSFAITATKAHVDFKTIFRNIQNKIEENHNDTCIYNMDDIRQFQFSGTLEDKTLSQILDLIKLSAPIEYALNGKTVKVSEN